MINSAFDVLWLFLIPIGGGIPAGVILARERGMDWPAMMILYFISDVILAFVFEFVLIGILRLAKAIPAIEKIRVHYKASMAKTIAHYDLKPGPFSLVLLSFGADPMTGRTAALVAGHGFVTGWLIAITGDMFFFSVIMISTLWLNSLFGNGTAAALVVMLGMFLMPYLIRRIRRPARS